MTPSRVTRSTTLMCRMSTSRSGGETAPSLPPWSSVRGMLAGRSSTRNAFRAARMRSRGIGRATVCATTGGATPRGRERRRQHGRREHPTTAAALQEWRAAEQVAGGRKARQGRDRCGDRGAAEAEEAADRDGGRGQGRPCRRRPRRRRPRPRPPPRPRRSRSRRPRRAPTRMPPPPRPRPPRAWRASGTRMRSSRAEERQRRTVLGPAVGRRRAPVDWPGDGRGGARARSRAGRRPQRHGPGGVPRRGPRRRRPDRRLPRATSSATRCCRRSSPGRSARCSRPTRPTSPSRSTRSSPTSTAS